MRWFLTNSKYAFDPTRTYPLHMALSIFQRPKTYGGFGLIDVKAKSLALKWKLLEKYRSVDCPFMNLLYSLLKVSRKKPGNVLSLAKKTPTNATGFARDLIQTAILIKPQFQYPDLDSVFSFATITYPQVPEIKSADVITVKEISLRILNAIQPFSELRKGQKKISSICPIDWSTVWRKLRSLKGLRPAVRSFLYRMLNAGLYLPSRCPLCSEDIDGSTLHFIQCKVINDTVISLSNGHDIFSFLRDPTAATKNCPQLPLLLFATYAVIMQIHFQEDKEVDYLPRVKIRLNEEIRRKHDAFIV
jgi:hypothetical protein